MLMRYVPMYKAPLQWYKHVRAADERWDKKRKKKKKKKKQEVSHTAVRIERRAAARSACRTSL